MAKMFVANCTAQIQEFMYRLPETAAPRMQPIPIGGQIQISGDLSPAAVEAIVDHHAMYGMIAVDEIDRTRPFFGICYALDRQIPVDKIRRGIAHNLGVLEDRGQEIREAAAVGAAELIDGARPGLKGLEMSVSELDAKNGKTGEFAEGIRVDKSAPPPSGKQRRKGK